MFGKSVIVLMSLVPDLDEVRFYAFTVEAVISDNTTAYPSPQSHCSRDVDSDIHGFYQYEKTRLRAFLQKQVTARP